MEKETFINLGPFRPTLLLVGLVLALAVLNSPAFAAAQSDWPFKPATPPPSPAQSAARFPLPANSVSSVTPVNPAAASYFKIIAVSDPTKTTHELKSGNFILGITDKGGGIINKVFMPGLRKDIMGKVSKSYGRAGQVAIRDGSHGGRYNPTQAGFYETLGTQCLITSMPGKLVVEPHGISLWHGDGKYDFTRWENIGPDPYQNDGGNSDEDGLEEEHLSVTINGIVYTKQEAEVYSEFDYAGVYDDVMGKYGITTPAIHHYYEIRFIRPPGHCINQHRTGTKVWNEKAICDDISHLAPSGVHKGTDKDMNGLIGIWSLRHDRDIWTPKYFYYRKAPGLWASQKAEQELSDASDNRVFIIADSNNPAQGEALGLYHPKTAVNELSIIGVEEKTGKIAYRDDRIEGSREGYRAFIDLLRTPTMCKYGFGGHLSGLINRTRLPAGIYEALRAEYYILYGTPSQIMEAVAKIDKIPPAADTMAFPH